ncbi:glycosyltransferase family 4 protein [Vibrio parahaemolyticus]|uniref:Glycosyl transferase family 1 domain-containing protein n=1 Tax=Vibrio parahaemolyticus TaxID=670 RepID=A0A7M1WD29_VIBPH|nr:glycosyltransferase family 4 protein [Vibrio parahaemolyticus]EJG0872015.1 glycosyltransferase family 4 protein [Vibrio parahaemolyticus O3]EJG0900674.1 glycosyltransferase family 4 protein [Vibrio parahaemolyticus O3:K56]EJG1074958.1 glycosyltransferase family 4 protein [Vibrio parahaemolyticus O1:K56]EGR1972833.1 glycosyltransferase [Vibrio parahaemolyticus]EGR5852639.1 glycosyltransferase [Vibrio parahaemolyticus]
MIITIFDRAEEVHLKKDVGKFSDTIAQKVGCNNFLLTTRMIDKKESRETLKRTKIVNIRNKKFFALNFSVISYIVRSLSANMLITYHLRYPSLIYAIIFKVLSHDGRSIIKCDLGDVSIKEHGVFHGGKIRTYIEKILLSFYSKIGGELTIETENAKRELESRLGNVSKRLVIKVVPNGIDPLKVSVRNKKKRVITVGRIGAAEKNHILLFNAIKRLKKENAEIFNQWEFRFIGPIEGEFLDIAEKNENKNIHFTGNLVDGRMLFEEYSEAKVFVLPSLSEGYPLVVPEAIYNDLYIISTPVSSVEEIIKLNGQFGEVLPDFSIFEMTDKLKKLLASEEINIKKINTNKNRLTWSSIVDDFLSEKNK